RARMLPGSRGMFTGKVQVFNRSWQLAQPHYVIFGGGDSGSEDEDGSGEEALAASLRGLMPVYPLTAKLYSWDLQKIIQVTLDLVTGVRETFPEELRRRFDLVDVMQALRWIHGPDDYSQVSKAQRRFRFEEALVLQLVLARRRAALRRQGAQARTGGQR